MKTLAIFRRWPDGQVIALFPMLAGTTKAEKCLSYEHISQHGSADPLYVVASTDPATPTQYASLRAELERAGYVLDVKQRVPSNAYTKRLRPYGSA